MAPLYKLLFGRGHKRQVGRMPGALGRRCHTSMFMHRDGVLVVWWLGWPRAFLNSDTGVRRHVLVKNHDRIGIDDADTLNWRELAAKRLARLVESEQAHSELQQQAERLRQEHYQLLTTLHEYTLRVASLEEQLENRDAELARLRLIAESWWGDGWRFAQWARRPANWLILGKQTTKRLLKRMASIRVLRRPIGLVLRLTPELRARLLATLGLT